MRMAPDTTDLSDRAYVWKTLDSAVASDPFQKLAYMISTGNLVRCWSVVLYGSVLYVCVCVGSFWERRRRLRFTAMLRYAASQDEST